VLEQMDRERHVTELRRKLDQEKKEKEKKEKEEDEDESKPSWKRDEEAAEETPYLKPVTDKRGKPIARPQRPL